MVLLEFAWSGAVFDAVGDMAERMEKYCTLQCIGFAGGMGGLGDCHDGSISRERCG